MPSCSPDSIIDVNKILLHLEVNGVEWVVKHIPPYLEPVDMSIMLRGLAAAAMKAPRAAVVLQCEVAGETCVIPHGMVSSEMECWQSLKDAVDQQDKSLKLYATAPSPKVPRYDDNLPSPRPDCQPKDHVPEGPDNKGQQMDEEQEGVNQLLYSAGAGCVCCVNELINKGVNINSTYDGSNCLDFALWAQQHRMIFVLKKAGALPLEVRLYAPHWV